MSLLDTLKYSTADSGDIHITITEGAFAGITFKYGKVWFKDPEEPLLSFDYDVIEPAPAYDKGALEQHLGEIIVEMLDDQLSKSAVVYTGGTDGVVDEI